MTVQPLMARGPTGRRLAHRLTAGVICVGLLGAGLGIGGCVTTVTTGPGPVSGQRPNGVDAARVNVQLGVSYLQQGQLAMAQTKLQRALQEDSHNADAHAAMAMLDERLGKSADADKEYRRALVLSQRTPSVLNSYAVYLCSHDRADEGVRYFEEAASNALYPTPWVAYTNAGVCLRNVHRDQEAMGRFARALQSNPTYTEAIFQAAGSDFAMQRFVQARLRLEVYLQSNPATPDLLLLGWRIARAQNDARGQQQYAARLAKEFPNSQQTRAIEQAADRGGSG